MTRLRRLNALPPDKGPCNRYEFNSHKGQVLVLERDGERKYFKNASKAADYLYVSPQFVSMVASGKRKGMHTCCGWTPKWIPYTDDLDGKVVGMKSISKECHDAEKRRQDSALGEAASPGVQAGC